MRKTVAIAGASGFIGRSLIAALRPDYDIIALSRSQRPAEPGLDWRCCDLFSLLQAEAGLAGADYAIYMVHSPLPRSGLTQGSFDDLDLILADNFVRACRRAGVKQIVYLGNLMPETGGLSRYLRSRLEVEQVLSAYDVPVTLLRAPVVIGPRGAPFELAVELVRRLPLMLVPRWTRTLNQPIALSDVVAIVHYVIGREALYGQTCDIGGPQVVSYLGLIQCTAKVLRGREPRVIPVPVLTPRLSRFWLAWVTGTPLREIIPLIESLTTPVVARDLSLQEQMGQAPLPLEPAIRQALDAAKAQAAAGAAAARPEHFKDMRSVQRLPLQPGQNALWLAEQYAGLLTRMLRPLMQARVEADHSIRFYHLGVNRPLLKLDYSAERSTPDRALFYITGGLIAEQAPGVHSRLEFRVIPGGRFALAGIHDFRPRLPWYLYLLTQANFHLWTMYAFIWYLKRRADG